ncbi:hypothetical protein PHYBOEH_008234 [Phytophthora boehmeriae]|uniref:Uncharacterized protein n=1 Tax=Phytophthora boehmeriae TaxID=109152 RepID=A0A8T1W2C0_9STRA|nr:hypothetical protein PHYBOEH_008234 [Phytophthora boehmeriae]
MLKAGANTDAIDSLDLAFAGRAYVSYADNLPQDVIGYVNVAGSSVDIVNAVTVGSKSIDNGYDDKVFDNYKGKLNVQLGTSNANGHLLTEIVVASGAVRAVRSPLSAQVVVEDGVLVTDSTTTELEIKATGSSAVFVSAAKAAVNVNQLWLDASGPARIEFKAGTVAVQSRTRIAAGRGSSTVSVLSSLLTTHILD